MLSFTHKLSCIQRYFIFSPKPWNAFSEMCFISLPSMWSVTNLWIGLRALDGNVVNSFFVSSRDSRLPRKIYLQYQNSIHLYSIILESYWIFETSYSPLYLPSSPSNAPSSIFEILLLHIFRSCSLLRPLNHLACNAVRLL